MTPEITESTEKLTAKKPVTADARINETYARILLLGVSMSGKRAAVRFNKTRKNIVIKLLIKPKLKIRPRKTATNIRSNIK